MMMRRSILALALASGALTTAPAAEATPLCQFVAVTGVVNQPVGPVCVPYGGTISCEGGTRGLLLVTVTTVICLPSVLGSGGGQ